MTNQTAKRDAGKPKLTLVPHQIIYDIARVREYGNIVHLDSDNWRTVEIERFRDAMYRHMLDYLEEPKGLDKDSGLTHLAHLACNVAFLCEMEKEEKQKMTKQEVEKATNILLTAIQKNTTCAGCGNVLAYDKTYLSDDGDMCHDCIFLYNNCTHCSKGTYNTVCNECKETFKEAETNA